MQDWTSHNAASVRPPSNFELASGTFASPTDVVSVARIDFAQMIEAAGAHAVVNAMAVHFGIADSTLRDIIARSGPFFLRAYQHWIERPDGVVTLNKLVRSGGPQQFAERPGLAPASVTRQEGQKFLEHMFQDDQVIDMVTERIATRLDINSGKLTDMMPNLAALFVGVLCKSITV